MEGLCSAEVRTPDPPLLQQIQEDVSSFFSPPLFFEAKQRELFLPLGCITEQQEEQQALCATVCRLQSGGQIEGWMDRERGEREREWGGGERKGALSVLCLQLDVFPSYCCCIMLRHSCFHDACRHRNM